MKKTFEKQTYHCSKLNNRVTLTLTYSHHQNDFKVISGYDCDSDKKCDIGQSDGKGGYSWNRDLCPAVQEIQKK